MGLLTIKKTDLRLLIDILGKTRTVIGPVVKDKACVFSEMGIEDIPAGSRDHQCPGYYELREGESEDVFSFSNGPDSLKRFLHPPAQKLYDFERSKKGISIRREDDEAPRYAFFGVRACDVAALKLYDIIFMKGAVRDPWYESIRKGSVIVAVNCLYPGDNCFCHSMGSGPEVTDGADMILSELEESFLIETKTQKGVELTADIPASAASESQVNEKDTRIQKCKDLMKKSVDSNDLPERIYRNLDSNRWSEIAKRDLECGNCTQVCPTCFCSSSYDSITLSSLSAGMTEYSGARERKWDSCFSRNFARVHGGNFRLPREARYRQWMAHKMAYMQEQFGVPGCVGCGRCITWCPAGIDITRELEELERVR